MSAAVESPRACEPQVGPLEHLVSGVAALDVGSHSKEEPAGGSIAATTATVPATSDRANSNGATAQPAPARRERSGHQHDQGRHGHRTQRSPRHTTSSSPGQGSAWPPTGPGYPPPSSVNVYAMYGTPLYPAPGLGASPPVSHQYFAHLAPGPLPGTGDGSPTHMPPSFPSFPSGSFGPGGYIFGSSPPTAAISEAGWAPQFHQPQHPPPPPHVHYAPPPPPRRASSSSGSLSGELSGSWQPDSSCSSGSGKAPCAFFMKTGTCAYGDKCKFDHPAGRQPPQLNSLGYPMRPNEVDCVYFMKKGVCGFGITCKFNHPEVSVPSWPRASPGTAPGVNMMPTSMMVYANMMGQPMMPVMPYPTSVPASSLHPVSVNNPGVPNPNVPSSNGWHGTPPPPPPPGASTSPGSRIPAAVAPEDTLNPTQAVSSMASSPTAVLHEILGISPPADSGLQTGNTTDRDVPATSCPSEASPLESFHQDCKAREQQPVSSQDTADLAPPMHAPVEAVYTAPPPAQEAVMAA